MTKNAQIRTAGPEDIEQIRQLFYAAYGENYPLPLGTDADAMRAAMANPASRWVVACEPGTDRIVGTMSMKADLRTGIGKAGGAVVAPDYRGAGLANVMLEAVCEAVGPDGWLNSMYGTARTVSIGPQKMCLGAGFKPYGLAPNSVNVLGRESIAFFVRHRDGVLENRALAVEVPEQLRPFLNAATTASGLEFGAPHYFPVPAAPSWDIPLTVLTEGPKVAQQYLERVQPELQIYPFHPPNVVLGPAAGDFEAYVELDRVGGCATLIGLDPLDAEIVVPGLFTSLMAAVSQLGCPYLEVIMFLDNRAAMTALVTGGFFPAAIYPAYAATDGRARDSVLMCRTSGPALFEDLRLHPSLQPYADYLRSLPTPYGSSP